MTRSVSNPFIVSIGSTTLEYTWPYAVLNSVSRITPLGDYDATTPGGGNDDTWISFQRYHFLDDKRTAVIRGTGNGHTYGYNSIRYFDPALALTPSTPSWGRYQNFGAPTNRIKQYNNHWHCMMPASAFGDGLGEGHFWPNYGIYRFGSQEWTHGPSIGEDIYRRNGLVPSSGLSSIVSIEHGVDPLVVTSVSHGVAGNTVPGLLEHAWYWAPGWSLHDKIYRVIAVSNVAPYSYRIIGADTTNDPPFTPGVIGGMLTPAWHLNDPNNFWPNNKPLWTDYIRDDSNPKEWDKFPSGQGVYNPFQDWWTAGEKALIVGGGIGSDQPYTKAWRLERNPNYPATQPQPWRLVDWPLQNIGPSGWVWRIHHNEGGKVVSNPGDPDYLYCAGGVTGSESTGYHPARIAHRIRCTDGWIERLPDLPAALPTTMYGMLSWDKKRHGILYIGFRLYWLDLDNIAAGWIDVTPYPIYNWTTKTGQYRPMSGCSIGYVESLDAHFLRGSAKLDIPEGTTTHFALPFAPLSAGDVEKFTVFRIRMPTAWIKE